MLVQMTMTRNELFLLKEMLPVWKKYADGFVFLLDRCDDGTYEYLMENKEKYNILSVLKEENENLVIESNVRQKLYDEALKFSKHILCLDTDEYLDGNLSKEQVDKILQDNKDTLIHLQWIQYTNTNEIRVDGPWGLNYKDRLGSYDKRETFKNIQMHSEHMPRPGKEGAIQTPNLFIAHLQWLDKKTVAVKQYYWKVIDYVNNIKYGVDVIPSSAYDQSVNNFIWQYSDFPFTLKIDRNVYQKHNIEESFKFKYIKTKIKEFNIPNLNDWGMNIHDS